MSVEDMQGKVDLMAKVFLGRLPVRFEKINEAFAQCSANLGDDGAWTELHRLLHSLAGAAGTFGFDAMGQHAKQIEKQVERILASSQRNDIELAQVASELKTLQSTQ
jgi:HPt (histidine-containing phosphotransfer) domain-containing protein